jgi:hypothetical protein
VDGTPSGVADTYYIIYHDGAEQGIKSVSVDGQPKITYEDDDNWLEYWSVDEAGNEEEHTTVTDIKLDKTPPAVSLTLDQQDEYYNSEPLPVTYEADDPKVQGEPSNAVTVVFDIDGTPVGDDDLTDVTNLVGTHTLTLTATDIAGNSNSTSVTFTVLLYADINIDPDTLNLYSSGNWISAYIEFPAGGYDVMTIDVNTLTLNGIVPAENNPKYDFVSDPQPVDSDGDGIPEFMAKFSRGILGDILSPADEVTLTVRGEMSAGTFKGTDTIRVIANGNPKNLDKKADLKVDKHVRAVEVNGERDKSQAKIEIDLWSPGNGYIKAVSVTEHIPEVEGLEVYASGAAYIPVGLNFQMGMVDQKETASYILTLPEVTEPTPIILKTVVEYQTFFDLETIEKTTTLTVNPKGPAKLDKGDEKKSVKAKGKGYDKVRWARPNFKAYEPPGSNGKKKGHDKDKGNPDKPDNPGKGNGKDKNK